MQWADFCEQPPQETGGINGGSAEPSKFDASSAALTSTAIEYTELETWFWRTDESISWRRPPGPPVYAKRPRAIGVQRGESVHVHGVRLHMPLFLHVF